MEKRKEVRLSLPNAYIKIQEQCIPVENISYSGLRLKSLLPLNSSCSGILIIGEESVAVDFKIVNTLQSTSGGIFLDPLKLRIFLEPWFNPQTLMSKLKPLRSSEGLFYEDHDHGCWFKFYFDQDKQINKINISIHNNSVVWEGNIWTTFSGSEKDIFQDIHKIQLVKNMIDQTRAFPQSFKDWLFDLF